MHGNLLETRELQLTLPRAIDREIAGDIEKESVFVSPWLERILINEELSQAKLLLRPEAPHDVVIDKASRFLDAMSKQRSGYDVKTFVETKRRDTGAFERGVDAALVAKGWVYDYGKGQVAYRGPVLALARLIDRMAAERFTRALAAEAGHFPSSVDADVLHKCGYLDSHPNAVSFIGNVIEDIDALEAFRRANSCSQGALLPQRQDIHIDGLCLNPAACLPCYPTLAGRQIADGSSLTWLGRVFRYESRNINGLARLFEFNVRELVFVGSEDYVRAARLTALAAIEEIAGALDLEVRVQTATDPFFATVVAAKKFWQATQEVKNEIMIPILDRAGQPKYLACGSINLHGNFFGSRFSIESGDRPAQTGCVGLGIERWVLACFTQHGFDPARWPQAIAGEIFR